METKSGKIFRRVLIGNRGNRLTVDEIIELSKKEEFSLGHQYFSKAGISEAFVHNNIASFHNKWVDLLTDPLFGIVTNIEWDDGKIISIHICEDSDRKSISYILI